MNIMNNRVFSQNFVSRFKKVVKEFYNFDEYDPFLIVPSLFSKKKNYVYLPILNYTDLNFKQAKELEKKAKTEKLNYQIRTLNFEYNNFKKNDPVTMRLYINKEIPLINHYKTRYRSYVRKSLKIGYTLKVGKNQIDSFYEILKYTYKKHGSPIFSIDLLKNLQKEFEKEMFVFVLYHNNSPASAMVIFLDNDLAWYSWGGVAKQYKHLLAGHCIYHQAIEYMHQNHNINIFDFGRSAFGGGTYNFKKNFGGVAVKIDILKPFEENLYEKYSLASKIYKKLPLFISNKLGPFLNRYLADR